MMDIFVIFTSTFKTASLELFESKLSQLIPEKYIAYLFTKNCKSKYFTHR